MKVEKTTDPIAPEIVLLGLNFVNFLPLKIFPTTKPPISEATHVIRIEKIKIFKWKKYDKIKKNEEKEKMKDKKNRLIKNFFIFFFLKIIEIILWNSNTENILKINKK